jgi:hypothetical protein
LLSLIDKTFFEVLGKSRLILPSNLAAEQQDSLHELLLDRDESLLMPVSDSVEPTPSYVEEATTNDVSTLENGGVSTAASSMTGTGQVALRALLAQAQTALSPSAWGATLNPRSAGDFFFLSATKTADASQNTPVGEDDGNSRMSDLSYDDENDQVSVAVSRVGQNALQALLATAGRKNLRKPQKPRPKPSRRPAATRKVKRRGRFPSHLKLWMAVRAATKVTMAALNLLNLLKASLPWIYF